jgi:hypothetical protein
MPKDHTRLVFELPLRAWRSKLMSEAHPLGFLGSRDLSVLVLPYFLFILFLQPECRK